MFKVNNVLKVSYTAKTGEMVERQLKVEGSKYGNPYILINDYVGDIYIGRLEENLIPEQLTVELVEKYYPKASYGGAIAQMRELVTDKCGNVLFLRLAGQEDQVRSITAVIMQGRMKQWDYYVRFGDYPARVYTEGMRRIIKPIGDGMVDCVLYHRTLLPTTGMEALLHVDGDCFESFKKYLQILPIPRLHRLENGDALERKIMQTLLDSEIIVKATTHVGCIEISVIDTEKLQFNDYEILREAVIDTLKGVGYKQVAVTKYDFMIGCPKLYAQDDLEYKKVHAKFFSPSMTWYITEYDPEEDRCFGYVKNEADEWCSEWGYFMLDELVNFENSYPYSYVERDLHFGDDYYLDIRGNLLKEAEIKRVAA